MKINASPNNMVPVEVAQASNLQINWLVAHILEEDVWFDAMEDSLMHRDREEDGDRNFDPVNDWGQGGPIIDEYISSTLEQAPGKFCSGINRLNKLPGTTGVPWISGFGSSHLEAAMRCLIISRVGDIAQVPQQIIDLESE